MSQFSADRLAPLHSGYARPLFKVLRLEEFTVGITDDTLDPIRAASFPVTLIRVPARRTSDEGTGEGTVTTPAFARLERGRTPVDS